MLRFRPRNNIANRLGTDILIQAPDPMKAALFYVKQLGFVKDEPDFFRCYIHAKCHPSH